MHCDMLKIQNGVAIVEKLNCIPLYYFTGVPCICFVSEIMLYIIVINRPFR